MILRTLKRFDRVARRYVATGLFRTEPSPIIDRFFGGRDCFFVQVGSNDGIFRDPLHELIKANSRWRGIFIEPNDEVFEKLVRNYPTDGRFAFERIAISNSNEDQWFHYVSSEDISREVGLAGHLQWISSFKRSHVLANVVGSLRHYGIKSNDPGAFISKKLVRCETLTSVLDRYHVSHLDLLHIDAEAHDYQVLQSLNFKRFSPRLILYEHTNLGDETPAARSFLQANGYRLVDCGVDTMAVKKRSSLFAR